jgi:hypothetical protein
MQNPVIAITDKVMSMLKSMVFLSMRVYYRRGATAGEISSFLNEWAPDGEGRYHEGIVERVLRDLMNEGAVARAGARWYVTAHPG